jgi:Methylamine utilisation protein MauE
MIGQSIASRSSRLQVVKASKLAIHFVQYFFVLLLAASGCAKLADMGGFFDVVATYEVLPTVMIPSIAWSLALLELALAIWLLIATQIKAAAGCLVALHFVYLIWLMAALLRGLHIPNCGCFGVYFPRPLTVFTLLEDLVLLSLSVWFFSRIK